MCIRDRYWTGHRHRGGMSNKTPPPTELQIPVTVTTLLLNRIFILSIELPYVFRSQFKSIKICPSLLPRRGFPLLESEHEEWWRGGYWCQTAPILTTSQQHQCNKSQPVEEIKKKLEALGQCIPPSRHVLPVS